MVKSSLEYSSSASRLSCPWSIRQLEVQRSGKQGQITDGVNDAISTCASLLVELILGLQRPIFGPRHRHNVFNLQIGWYPKWLR